MSYTSLWAAILLVFLCYIFPEILYPKFIHHLYCYTLDYGHFNYDDDSNIIFLSFSSIKPNPFSFYALEIPPKFHDESK